MDNYGKFFIGMRTFLITPDKNPESVNKNLIKNKLERKHTYGLSIDSVLNDTFDATYKFGNNMSTKITGNLTETNITVTCMPDIVVMIIMPLLILSLILPGIFLFSFAFVNKNIGTDLLFIGSGLYAFFIILLYFIHKHSIKAILSKLGGGQIMNINA